MLIHLSEVLSTVGKRRTYEAELEMKRFCVGRQEYRIVSRMPVRLELVHTGGQKIVMTGQIQATVEFPCDRCLEPVPYPFDLCFEREADLNGEENPEEQSYIVDHCLDTEQLAVEELLMHMPMKILCREDCKGICNRCGANLNQGDCGCGEEPKDPRMAAILDLFRATGK